MFELFKIMQVRVNFLSSCYSPDAWMVLGSQKRAGMEQAVWDMVNIGNSLHLEIIETNSVTAPNKKLNNFMAITTQTKSVRMVQNITLQRIN